MLFRHFPAAFHNPIIAIKRMTVTTVMRLDKSPVYYFYGKHRTYAGGQKVSHYHLYALNTYVFQQAVKEALYLGYKRLVLFGDLHHVSSFKAYIFYL